MKTGVKVSLEEAHVLLKKFKHVIHDNEAAKMSASMNADGLIIKIKSYGESVMLFPFGHNESVIVGEDSITLKDINNWTQVFTPLIVAKLWN